MSYLTKIAEAAIRGARWAVAVQDWDRVGGGIPYYIRMLSHLESFGLKFTLSVSLRFLPSSSMVIRPGFKLFVPCGLVLDLRIVVFGKNFLFGLFIIHDVISRRSFFFPFKFFRDFLKSVIESLVGKN